VNGGSKVPYAGTARAASVGSIFWQKVIGLAEHRNVALCPYDEASGSKSTTLGHFFLKSSERRGGHPVARVGCGAKISGQTRLKWLLAALFRFI
jgi:hypothetical protein